MYKRNYQLLLALWLSGAVALAGAADDPTRPPSASVTGARTAGAPTLRLQAVRSQGDTRLAVINGRSVKVGERVGGARVSRIEARSVVVIRNGKSERLELGQPLTKHWKKQD